MSTLRTLALFCALALVLVAIPQDAAACACCTNEGQRNVGVEKLEQGRRAGLDGLRFSADAQLFTGEGDPDGVKGIATPSSRYELHVSQEPARWTFDFRDKAGRTGKLVLTLPATVSVFEVDPRLGERQGGQGPVLYKEWKLTSKATGTGIFGASVGGGQLITLILQGHGNSCTSADHFSHWTLVVSGPKAQYHLFGEFIR